MNKTTRLTQQDLQIYPSQRMTDTPDGGGLMTGAPLTGEDNEIFPPVSDVDRTMGSFDARLLYPAVLRNDAEPLYGGHFVITEPPKSPNVSFLAFKARNYGETRADIMPRIEAYSVPTVESRMTLLGRHLAGVRLIQAYQRVEAPLPKVGERYCLEFTDTRNAATARRYEYFRVQNIESEVRTFEIPQPGGTVKEIQRRVVKMEITNPLVNDYEGVNYPVEGYAGAPVKILETQVADSASYYGVKPVKTALKKGDAALTVSSIFEKLVPTSTVETPYADQYPVADDVWVASGAEKTVYSGYVSGTLNLPCAVVPGSVSAGNYRDNGQGILSDGRNIATIDYQRGIISGLTAGTYTVKAVPGAKTSAARYAFDVEVKETNQGSAWAPLLRPAPALGSLTVSFMALGVWYTLRDNGSGNIVDESGTAVGTVSPQTGSVLLNLPVQPDVGSRIVFQWGDFGGFISFDNTETGKPAVPRNPGGRASYDLGHPVKPGTLVLEWNDNGSKRASDDGKGRLTGDAAGTVDYYDGKITLDAAINAQAVSYRCDEPPKIDTEPVSAQKQGGNWEIVLADTPLPHTFNMSVAFEFERRETAGTAQAGTAQKQSSIVMPSWASQYDKWKEILKYGLYQM